MPSVNMRIEVRDPTGSAVSVPPPAWVPTSVELTRRGAASDVEFVADEMARALGFREVHTSEGSLRPVEAYVAWLHTRGLNGVRLEHVKLRASHAGEFEVKVLGPLAHRNDDKGLNLDRLDIRHVASGATAGVLLHERSGGEVALTRLANGTGQSIRFGDGKTPRAERLIEMTFSGTGGSFTLTVDPAVFTREGVRGDGRYSMNPLNLPDAW